MGNNIKKHLAYAALVRLIFDYVAVCWGPCTEGQVSDLNRMQKWSAKFANNVARMCAHFRAYTGGGTWKAIRDGLLEACYLSRENLNRKIRDRKQRIYVGKYSFLNLMCG